jgi:hypothetical protein
MTTVTGANGWDDRFDIAMAVGIFACCWGMWVLYLSGY